jgi:hypothetical protein
MGFKADTSFLRFLSMGAAGARQTISQLRASGFEPIELERYCTSNKIWTTKVKRLRLPDIQCVRTGLRVEVRAKTDLKIRMSDAPANPDRRWNTGLRDEDLCAFIACADENGTPTPAAEAVFFSVSDLKSTEGTSELGPPKSASEGAERDRTWPSIVPSRSGSVEFIDKAIIRVTMDADGNRQPRSQTYQLRGKTPYAAAGERFTGEASIIAGSPRRRVNLQAYRDNKYDPLAELASNNAVDRYAAVKSLPHRPDLKKDAVSEIEKRLDVETDDRVLLEAAGAGSVLGSAKARDRIETFIWEQERPDLRMEAILILTELRSASAPELLKRVATDARFADDEIRQAAVWGLGKAGVKQYGELVAFIGDDDRDVALHAIAGFGTETSAPVIDALIAELVRSDPKRAPAASEALRNIGSDTALTRLIAAARANAGRDGWILATLGRLSAEKVRAALRGDALLDRLAPILLLSKGANWISDDTVDIDLKFLLKQNL